MSETGTAGQQLERILYLLPLAGREGGVGLAEAAERLGVSVSTVQRDIEEMTARAFYHPAGGADEIQILLEADRVRIYSNRKFDRPTKLSGREMLALAVGLRAAAAEAPLDAAAGIRDLAHRIEMELAVTSSGGEEERFEIAGGDHQEEGVRSLLRHAVGSGTSCRIRYLKPAALEPEERDVDPYAVAYASGRWYLLAYCHLREEVRAFRLDRMLEATPLADGFEKPGDFDPAHYVADGRVFRSDGEEQDVVVSYSARVAPWVREHGPVQELGNGGVSVSFTTADQGWIVRHVLQYGPEAEILAPSPAREMLIETLSGFLLAN